MTAVKERIAELTSEAAVRAGVSIERVLKELVKIAFANMGDYVNKAGVVDPSTLSPDQLAAISEVDLSRAEVKLLDKRAALPHLKALPEHEGEEANEDVGLDKDGPQQALGASRDQLTQPAPPLHIDQPGTTG